MNLSLQKYGSKFMGSYQNISKIKHIGIYQISIVIMKCSEVKVPKCDPIKGKGMVHDSARNFLAELS